MNILVTTPTGKVGQEVAKQLLAKDATVRVGAHTLQKARALHLNGADIVPFSFEDEASAKAALQGMDALYLAFPSTMSADYPQRVIDLAKSAGVKRVVMLSAKGVENSDTDIRHVEQHLEASGLEYTILRANWFFQNFNTGQLEYIRQAGAIIEPSGDGKTSFIDTRDIAAVAVKALTEDGHNGKAYALTGNTAHHRNEVAKAISSATGKQIAYKSLTDEDFRVQAKAEQWPGDVMEIMSWLYGTVRSGWTEETTDTVKQLLGREPMSLEQYASDHKEDWL
jgi:uncharacterized protein YbjT (DUF2867 family)